VAASVFGSDLALRVASAPAAGDARLRACVHAHLGAVWRVLRRHGVSEADADDAAQRVFLVLARKLDAVEAGHELAFLVRTATFVASETRRARRRRRESDDPPPERIGPSAHEPDAVLEQREALARLDAILERMEEPLRTVFVLHEIEELTMAEIAEALAIPPGTVASRLRRAREELESMCEVMHDE
jgi:RNA polymerase sigma-70 factor (ECF subfamily)